MNLHALRIFVEVAREESVSRAAENLRISQPAVTAQLRKLEQELGINLVAPSGRGIQLTENGRLLFQKAQKLFAIETEIEESIELLQTGQLGRLRLAGTHLPSLTLLPHWMAQFKMRYPDAECSLVRGNTDDSIERLTQYQVEIAIIAGEVKRTEEIEMYKLMENEWCFIVHPEHPLAHRNVSLKECLSYPFVWREIGSSTREKLIQICRQHNLPLPPNGFQLNGLYESVQAITAGYGVMLVPEIAVHNYIEQKRVSKVQIDDFSSTQSIHLCLRNHSALSPVALHFVQIIEEQLGKHIR